MTDFIQVVTTTDSQESAKRIGDAIVKVRLAACAQVVGPILSTYWWEGRVEETQEWLVILKSRRDLYGQIEEAIAAAHPYDVPEVLAVPVEAGGRGYLEWLNQELRTPDTQ